MGEGGTTWRTWAGGRGGCGREVLAGGRAREDVAGVGGRTWRARAGTLVHRSGGNQKPSPGVASCVTLGQVT